MNAKREQLESAVAGLTAQLGKLVEQLERLTLHNQYDNGHSFTGISTMSLQQLERNIAQLEGIRLSCHGLWT